MYRDVGDVIARVQETVAYLDIDLQDINQRSMFDDTPLIVVVGWGDVAAAKLLLQSGADVDARGENGDTALHRAALFGHGEVASLLLKNGASASAMNLEGLTALEWATRCGSAEVVEVLRTVS